MNDFIYGLHKNTERLLHFEQQERESRLTRKQVISKQVQKKLHTCLNMTDWETESLRGVTHTQRMEWHKNVHGNDDGMIIYYSTLDVKYTIKQWILYKCVTEIMQNITNTCIIYCKSIQQSCKTATSVKYGVFCLVLRLCQRGGVWCLNCICTVMFMQLVLCK